MAGEIVNANIDVHVHPFMREGWNRLEDVVDVMGRNGLDIIALESYNANLHSYVIDAAERLYRSEELVKDPTGIILPDGKVILKAREYKTKEDFHILTVGSSFDEANGETTIEEIIERGLEEKALVVLDHPFVDNFKTRTAGHICEEQEEWLVELCKRYSGKIAIEWNGYSIPWIRLGLRLPLAVLGYKTRYSDVNKHAKRLANELKEEGYNVPLLADTDLHARRKWLLDEMGAARFITDVHGDTPREMLDSVISNVFSGKYENVERYPSSAHVMLAYCIPVMFPQVFPKPRA
jgi:hypothetical protein